MEATISADGQLTVPAELLKGDEFRKGSTFSIERLGPGEYRLKRNRELKPVRIERSAIGLPVIRAKGVIATEMVRRLEAELM